MSANNLAPGMSGIALDIFIKAGSTLYDPATTPVFEIKDANGFQQGSGYYWGTRINIGHFHGGEFLIPAATSGTLGDWTITWNVGLSSKIETFSVAAPTLSIVGNNVNVLDQIYDSIRIDIGDLDGTIFGDAHLERYLISSIIRLNRELGIASGRVRPTGITPGGLGTPARIPAIVLDLSQRTVTPNNDEIHDIIILQAKVLITRSEMSMLRRVSAASSSSSGEDVMASGSAGGSAGDGVMVKNADGVVIDTRSRASSWLSQRTKLFLDEAKQREVELKDAIKQLKHSFSSGFGKVIY